jgi:protein-tyrosine phosphatase
MIKVLFVCLGNICRSPMAEAIFLDYLKKLELTDSFEVASAGTANYHIGKEPDSRTLKVLKNRQINFSHKGQQVLLQHFYEYDIMFAMDSENLANLEKMKPEDSNCKLALIRKFDEFAFGGLDVPDPYYGAEKDFIVVYNILATCIEKLLEDYQSFGHFAGLESPKNHTNYSSEHNQFANET